MEKQHATKCGKTAQNVDNNTHHDKKTQHNDKTTIQLKGKLADFAVTKMTDHNVNILTILVLQARPNLHAGPY